MYERSRLQSVRLSILFLLTDSVHPIFATELGVSCVVIVRFFYSTWALQLLSHTLTSCSVLLAAVLMPMGRRKIAVSAHPFSVELASDSRKQLPEFSHLLVLPLPLPNIKGLFIPHVFYSNSPQKNTPQSGAS